MQDENIKEMEYIGLSMVGNNLTPPDEVVFPEGYTFRLFQDGDEHHWARIAYEADEFDTIPAALNYFSEHFASQKEKLYSCCFFCCNAGKMPVGTAAIKHPKLAGFIDTNI